jgi:hypothetical protein
MAVIWDDGVLSPEWLIRTLEAERRHWLETAASFDRLKTYLSGTFSLKDAEENAKLCRQRAQKLEATIKHLREEYQIRPFVPPQEPPVLFVQ